MLSSICGRICKYFVSIGAISSKDIGLYEYGLHQGIVMLVNLGITILIGSMLGMVWGSILFLLAYVPIRSYAGGFHAKTPLRCFLCSVFLIIVVLLAMKFVFWVPWLCWIGIGAASIVILVLAPIEDKNKPFTSAEEKVFKKRARALLLLEIVVAFAFSLLGYLTGLSCILLSLSTVAVMLLLGKIKNNHLKEDTFFYAQ